MFAGVNIPKIKSQLLCNFLVKYCHPGSSCNTIANGLRYYANYVYKSQNKTVKTIIANKPLALIIDENNGETSRSLLNFIFIMLEPKLEGNKSLFINTVFLEVVSNVSAGQAIISTVV